MKEPRALNLLAEESERLRKEAAQFFNKNMPDSLCSIMSETSFFFYEIVAYRWLEEKKFDDLIEYIIYEYGESGGDKLWTEALFSMRESNVEEKADKLMDALYKGRVELFNESIRALKKYPDNHFCVAAAAKHRGDVMKVLYEHAFTLENKPVELQNEKLVKKVRDKISYIANK